VAHRRVLRRHERVVGALAAARRATGVDVRLLVPGASDIPMISPVSRAAYKPLLDGGVRVFEWNGTMMHAKMRGRRRRVVRASARPTSTSRAGWANYELDVAIEDRASRSGWPSSTTRT
jgi:cardiolipin synthase